MSTAHTAPAIGTTLHVYPRADSAAGDRRGEPVTVGVPLPRGLCRNLSCVALADQSGRPIPVQLRALDTWPDGSIRWVLLDSQIDSPGAYTLTIDPGNPPHNASAGFIKVTRREDGIDIDTGTARFWVDRTAESLLEERSAASPPVSGRKVRLEAVDHRGQQAAVRIACLREEVIGPLRSTLRVDGTMNVGSTLLLRFVARLHFFSASSTVRLELTVHNPRRAQHPGGFWELGDAGSVFLRDMSVRLEALEVVTAVQYIPESGSPPLRLKAPASLYQDSSGGENWMSTVHVNREGRVPLQFRGYRLVSAGYTSTGARATPRVQLEHNGRTTAVALRHFWQNFPKALDADERGLAIRLFPKHFGDLHELQGGEQKTHVMGLAFGVDGIVPLDVIQNPSVVSAEPSWYAACEAVPYLTAASDDPHREYLSLVDAAIEGPDTFERKREVVDEYGWRNFGDIYADHEAVAREGQHPLVSHYNNQYDAVAGFAIQFMRTADPRWWSAMEDLAGHVVDVDLYHTTEDKAGYNGGLFWHTFHYKDAGRATHRGYPRVSGVYGGGQSNEHDYSTGLLLHYYLTGQERSRGAVIQLAEWVLAMDDGSRTVFRWFSRADTGLASSTASPLYHGPGRGAANSIVTLMNAYRLTQERRFLDKAELIIRRCIHPDDDIDARHLLDAERRWSYTVFLQVLGRYLDEKILRNELDCRYAYARESLLRYARWMAEHEYPYLDKPEVLEYPTETWAAQDMRKSDVFKFAARHAAPSERTRFLDRSDFFFRTSIETLQRSATRTLARPVVLMLSYGYMHSGFRQRDRIALAPEGMPDCRFDSPADFVPQKEIAKRRAVLLAGALLLLSLLAFGIWAL